MFDLREKAEAVLASGSQDYRFPVLGKGFESNIKGLHIVGDLAGAPVIKLAMAQAVELVEHLAGLPEMQQQTEGVIDVLVIGAGAAGLNAALAVQDRQGKRYCSWICGCGGLAETFGDRWRHFAPKGRAAIRLEIMGAWVLIVAAIITLAMLGRDILGLYRTADYGVYLYGSSSTSGWWASCR